ncbi:MAG TPA: hypothetical protein DCS67_06160 [Clostridiales bacterium UBA8960]|jgi:uncharacterized protein with FMN-binding domain|nr:hypothetical protein [Clostridiales bacterium UBA8960]
MNKKLKRMGWIFLILTIVIGLAFTVFLKKTEENFETLMSLPVPIVDMTKVSDGTYTGAYSVFPVDVNVTVEVSAQKIIDITIDKHVNGQGEPAEAIIDSVIREQSLDVDMISGATYSSKVILKAIENALVK